MVDVAKQCIEGITPRVTVSTHCEKVQLVSLPRLRDGRILIQFQALKLGFLVIICTFLGFKYCF